MTKQEPPSAVRPLTLPSRTMRYRQIISLTTGAVVCSAGFIGPDCGDVWEWASNFVAAECECEPDDVHVVEDPERACDVLTARGEAVYILN